MNKTQYNKLLSASTDQATFVVTSKKELHAQVRGFLAFAIGAFVANKKDMNDARVAIKVALEFNQGYARHVRSAMSSVHKNQNFSYDESGTIHDNKSDKDRTPVSVAEAVEKLNASLDKIDKDSERPVATEEKKLQRAAKAFTTSLHKADNEKLSVAIEAFNDLDDDQLRNLYNNLATMTFRAEALLQLRKAA